MDGERLMVKDWDRVFFYKEAYSVRGEIQWGRWPACRRSLAYSRLAKTTAGHTAMWVFGAIVGMLHKRRSSDGLMVHENGVPFSVEDIRTMSELTTKQVVAGVAMLRSTEIGWIRPEAEERDRRMRRDQPVNGRLITGAQPARSRATTGLEERRGEENNSSISLVRVPSAPAHREPAAAAAAILSDEEQKALASSVAELQRRPEWLPDGLAWLDDEGATEVAMVLGGIPQKRANAIWDQVLKNARKSKKTLENPAGYVIAKIRKACAAKAGGAA